jgi:glycylpeptide N-tetradecanoyltransferase
LGFISGTPCKIVVNGQVIKMAEINLLCVHKKLRDKKMTPTLIKEITRRIQLQNTWQAYYTSGSTFPYPFTHA